MNKHQFPLRLVKHLIGNWIEDAQGRPLGVQFGFTGDAEEARTDAQEILRMANAYNALVAALQAAEPLLAEYAIRLSDDGEMTGSILDDMRLVRDALRKAEAADVALR